MKRRLVLLVAAVLVALAPAIPGQALEPRTPREPRQPRTPGTADSPTPDTSRTRSPSPRTQTQPQTEAPSAAPSPATQSSSSGFHASIESQILSLINQGRAGNGRGSLVAHGSLRSVARQHSRHQATRGHLTHAGFRGRIDQALPVWSAACENVARFRPAGGQAVAPSTVASRMYSLWLNSTSHRRCMFDARGAGYRLAGVGVYQDSTGGWWATFYAAR